MIYYILGLRFGSKNVKHKILTLRLLNINIIMKNNHCGCKILV